MNQRMLAGAVLATLIAAPALAADVGISVNVGQPGFYGRIDIGNAYPQPVLVYPQPVVIVPGPVAVVQQPIYLHVPPGHANNWGKHCGRYNACGQRVYFVQDSWYNQVYVPSYGGGRGYERDDDDHDRDRGHGKGKGHKNKNKHDD